MHSLGLSITCFYELTDHCVLAFVSLDSRFWNKLIVKPLGPARAGHTDMSHFFPTGEFFTKEKLYVFGGYSNSQHLCNDLHALDVGMYKVIIFLPSRLLEIS